MNIADKHEWRKHEKAFYLAKNKTEIIEVPKFKFISIEGTGSPDEPVFSECIEALYTLAYTIKMTLKKYEAPPPEYRDYSVYPLEGIWDINDEAKRQFSGDINKEDFVYKLMIRQPDFVDKNFFSEMQQTAF